MKKLLHCITLQLCLVALAQSQDKAIHYKELQKHLPVELFDFVSEDDPEGNMFEMNELSYSSASREYVKGESYLTISILDYKSASALYQASTMAWAGNMAYEDDEQKASSVTVDGMTGWLSYNKIDRESQLIIGCKERYLITILHSEAEDEGFVKKVVEKLNLNSLP